MPQRYVVGSSADRLVELRQQGAQPAQLTASWLARYRETAAAMDAVGRDHGLILHAAAPTGDGLLIVNLWPSRDGSEAAAGDPRRHAALRHAGLGPGQQRKEHHVLERYVVFA
jgi:hypothetical protein